MPQGDPHSQPGPQGPRPGHILLPGEGEGRDLPGGFSGYLLRLSIQKSLSSYILIQYSPGSRCQAGYGVNGEVEPEMGTDSVITVTSQTQLWFTQRSKLPDFQNYCDPIGNAPASNQHPGGIYTTETGKGLPHGLFSSRCAGPLQLCDAGSVACPHQAPVLWYPKEENNCAEADTRSCPVARRSVPGLEKVADSAAPSSYVKYSGVIASRGNQSTGPKAEDTGGSSSLHQGSKAAVWELKVLAVSR